MANGSRDVDLVIRAKDQTTRVVDQITKALNGFVDSSEEIAAGTKKSGSSLERLGRAFGDLNKTMRGLSAASRVAQLFDQAQVSADKLDKSLASTRDELDKLDKSMADAATQTAKLNKEVAETGANLEKQNTGLKKNQTAHRALNTELRTAVAERGKLETAERNLTARIADQEARLGEAQARYDRISQEIAGVEAPTKRMVNALEAANKAIAKQQSGLAESQATLASTREAIEATSANVASLTGRVEASNAALAQQKGVIDQTQQEYRALTQASREAAKAEGELVRAHTRTASALAALEKETDAVQQDLAQIRTEADRAEQAMSDLAAATRGPLNEAYRQQQSVISRINNEYQEHRKELAALSALMGAVGVPTREMVEAYNRLNAVSRDVKTEYRDQQAVLKLLRAELNNTTTDSQELAAQQRLFAQAVANGNAALGRVAQATEKAAGASRDLVAENNKAAASYARTASEARQTAGATDDLARANDRAADSYRRQANASRQAMSYVQRLRGEVLSLISAYGGIFGVITLLEKTVSAYQTLEAATSRLNAVNDNNQGKVANELDFIRRNADRLGIQFGLLSDEYTKFAAATQGTAIAGQKTRDIFISIAEAGRVNKLSFEDLQGVFRAVIQIASKGKFQLEELSGQLGDRLPGALKILADGLGVTTEELLELTKQGAVSSNRLIEFANELDRRYGSALAGSLNSLTTQMGRLQNATFQALIAFGEGGFIEGFTQLVKDLIEVLQDPAFIDFAGRISAGLGILAEAIGVAAKNFDLLIFALSGLAGIKISGWLIAAGAAFTKMGAASTGAAAAVTATTAATTAAGVAAGTAAVRVGLLARAVQLLTSSTGFGLLITGASLALGYWATQASEATDALTQHRKVLDEVKNAYEAVGQSVDDWKTKLDKVTKTEAEANLKRLTSALDTARKQATQAGVNAVVSASGLGRVFNSAEFNKQADALKELIIQFKRGKLGLDDYKKALDAIAQTTTNENIKEVATEMLEAAEGTRDLESAVKEAALVVQAFGPDSAEAKVAIEKLAGSIDGATASTDAGVKSLDQYKSVLQELKGLIPEFADELKKLEKQAELNGIIGKLGFDQLTPELVSLARQAQTEIDGISFKSAQEALAGFTDGVEAATALIKKRESFESMPYDDGRRDDNGKRVGPAVYRAGFGSDTITLADGSIQKVTKGVSVSLADAQRDLARRITTEFMPKVISQVGKERFESFNPQQQAVLTSIAYNYGELPKRIIEAVRTGSAEEISTAIRGLAGDNGGINKSRRNEEAFLFGNQEFADKAGDRAVENWKKRTEAAAEYHEKQAENISQMQFELSLQDMDLIKKEQAKAIREAENEAKKAGTTLTEQERQAILANVEAKYREEAAQEAVNAKKKTAEEAEQKVNDLLTRRNELEAQLKIHKEQGNTELATAAKTEIEGINTELTAAIDNAIKMWEAVGGPGADAAIAKLQTARLETQNFSLDAKTALVDWKRVGELFASGLTNAFDRFAQSVAEGKKVGEAAAEAFLQFAADFLIEIGKMIIQQTILNLLRGLGGPFASLGMVGVGHTGGVVGSKRIGSGNSTRRVDPSIFAGAPRFHDGYAAGLRPGELAAVLKKDEEVLTRDDPRHVLNGGMSPAAPAAASPMQLKIVNAFDSATVVSEGMQSGVGQETLINVVRQNAGTIRDIINS